MAKVLNFPLRQARVGGVWCEPLKLPFPQVFRVVQVITEDQVREWGVDKVAPGEFEYFTLDPDPEVFVGLARSEPLRSLPQDARNSLIIRHHAELHMATSYLGAVGDMDPGQLNPIFRTDRGIFTLAEIRTLKHWPGPMIFYAAFYSNPAVLGGEDHWEFSASPGGEPVPTQLLGISEEDAT